MKPLTVKVVGLLALLGVIALCVAVNAPRIEAKLRARAMETASRLDAAWAGVEIDGRDILVRGVPPDDDGGELLAALRGIDGVRSVRLEAAAAPVAPSPEPRFVAARAAPDGPIVLQGMVPPAAAAERLAEAPELAAFDIDASGLQSGQVHLKGAPELMTSAVAALADLDSGRIEIGPDRIVVSGQLSSAEAEEVIRARFGPFLGLGYELVMAVGQVEPEPASVGAGEAETSGAGEAVEAEAPAVLGQCQAQVDAALAASGNVRFANGSARLHGDSIALLEKLAGMLRGCPGSVVTIVGHTDDRGPADANQRLSEARAVAVGDFLVARGIDATRIRTRGAGESEPVADNATAEGRARNRRIDIILEEKDQ